MIRCKRRGFLLLVVVGVLSVLSLLAIQFSRTSHLSDFLSRNRIEKTHAKILARSGLQKAVVAGYASAMQLPANRSFSLEMTFSGEDRDRNGAVDSGEDFAGNNDSVGQIDSCELDRALAPSFAVADASGRLSALFPIAGRAVGYSWLVETVGTTSLRVDSVNGVIDVNGGLGSWSDKERFDDHYDIDTAGSSATSVDYVFNQPTVAILNALGDVIRWESLVDDEMKTYDWDQPVDSSRNLLSYSFTRWIDDVDVDPLGIFVVSRRPEDGYQRVAELEPLFRTWAELSGLSPQSFWDRCRDLVTVQSTPSEATRLWRQYGLPYHLAVSGQNGGVNQVSMGYRDQDTARLYLRTRSYTFPKTVININSAPEVVVAALIRSVESVYVRREIMPSTDSQSDGHVQLAACPEVGHLLENGYPPLLNNGGMYSQKRPRHLFSVTESKRLAKELVEDRRRTSLGSHRDFYRWLIERTCGYDHRTPGTLGSSYQGALGPSNASHARRMMRFGDVFDFNQRHRVLATILNPNGDLRHFCHDSALPLTSQKKQFQYQGLPMWISGAASGTFNNRYSLGRTGVEGKDLFDKSYPHVSGAEVSFQDTGRFFVRSLGRSIDPEGRELARHEVKHVIDLWEAGHLTSQKDFVEILQSGEGLGHPHDALTDDWITYPECVLDHDGGPSSVPDPAGWDGQMALRPLTPEKNPGLGPLTSHHRLSGYEGNADEMLGQLAPRGPSLTFLNQPAYTSDITGIDLPLLYLGSPWPHGNDDMIPSQLAQTHDASREDLDRISRLMPGGGFFPDAGASVMESNGSENHPQRWRNVRLAGMTISDNRTDGTKIFGDIASGAVSFLFKPHSQPLASISQADDSRQSYGAWARTPYCLFDYSFFVDDDQLRELINQELVSTGDFAPLLDARGGLIRGNIRLLYGSMWNAASNTRSSMNRRLLLAPLNQNVLDLGMVDHTSWYQPASPGVYITPRPSETYGGSEVSLFKNMNGMTAEDGSTGHLVNGDRRGHNVNAVQDRHHPYVSNKLWLEFKLSIVTDCQTLSDADSGRVYKTPFQTELTRNGYRTSGNYRDLYDSATQSQDPDDLTPLFADDTYSGRSTGVHTVMKSFRIDYPIVLDPTSDLYCAGPKDSENLPLAMLDEGRWHHMTIVWRNMASVMRLDQTPGRGGCVAVYHNGTFRRAVEMGSPSNPADDWQYHGQFWHSDYSTTYFNSHIYSPSFSATPNDPLSDYGAEGVFPGEGHPGQRNMDFKYPAPDYAFDPSGALIFPRNPNAPNVWFVYPSLGSSAKASVIQGLGMESEGYTSPSPELGSASLSYYQKGSLAHFAGHTTRRVESGAILHENYNVMHHAAHRLFFGSAPAGRYLMSGYPYSDGATHSVSTHKYVADGTFMDIRVAEAPADEIFAGDGGFIPELPDFDVVSVYPRDADDVADPNHHARVFPFRSGALSKYRGRDLLGISWTAWLPEFHTFWDDVNGKSEVWDEVSQDYSVLSDGVPGPDDEDQMVMRMRLESNEGDPWIAGDLTQWATVSHVDELRAEQARPRTHDVAHARIWPVVGIPEEEYGLSLKINCCVGSPSDPSPIMATPLIDDITVYVVGERGWRALPWR